MPNPKPTLQDEVVNDIRNQSIGSHRVADLNLPEDYLRRVADRVLRSAFEKQFRVVVRDREDEPTSERPSHDSTDAIVENTGISTIQVVDHVETPSTRNWRDSLIEGRPALRGFRAPLLDQREHVWPVTASEDLTASESKAADWVATHLATDGLVPTLAAVIELLGPTVDWDSKSSVERLRSVGLPVDLLAAFRPPGQDQDLALIAWVARAVNAGIRPADAVFQRVEFTYSQSLPGFLVGTESGEHDPAALRMQLTRGSYWDGPGDGGNLDLTRHVLEQLPNTKAYIHVESRFLASAQSLIQSWGGDYSDRLTLISEPRIISQWAQDNGKPGLAGDEPVTIVPRFASRGEDGPTFVPGDTFLLDGFRDAGAAVVQSPLLFQGGNLLPVRNPQTGERILLMGEAEIHRNVSLGLSRQQVIEAFRIEFGVDRCEALPAVSFHIDYDVCVRAVGPRLVAFVNDHPAACRIILECGVGAMIRHSLIDPASADKAIRRLHRADHRGFLEILGPAIGAFINANGQVPLSVAEAFSVSPVDSGVGNVQRFMLAIDWLVALSTPPAMLASIDAHGYYAALVRNERDTAGLHRAISELGLVVVRVPSLSAGERSVTAINGIHLKSAYLVPSYGGLFSPLDAAAVAVFEKQIGPSVRVVAIRSGESQRRNGSVHCSISVLAEGSGGSSGDAKFGK